MTCAVASLKLKLAAEDLCQVYLGRCFFKRIYRRLVLDSVCGDLDLFQSFDNGRKINILDNAAVLAEMLGILFVNYHNPASLNAGYILENSLYLSS